MTKLLVVTEAGDAWPSGFVRALIYKDLFCENKIDVRYVERQSPSLIRLKERTGRSFTALGELSQGAQERYIASIAPEYEMIYLQKVLSPKLVRAIRASSKARIVYDLNDAVWLPSWGTSDIGELLKSVDAVTCDNPFGLEFARTHNPNCFLVPDPPQLESFDELRGAVRRNPSQITLGWVGSRGTAHNLFAIWEALETVAEQNPAASLRILGTGDGSTLPKFERVRYSTLSSYSRRQLVREALAFDIGLFPLFDVDDSRARGILKATVYMAAGAAVIASPVGQNSELIVHGKNGLLATNRSEWIEGLTLLIQDAARRRKIAAEGLATVRKEFTLRQCFGALATALGLAPPPKSVPSRKVKRGVARNRVRKVR